MYIGINIGKISSLEQCFLYSLSWQTACSKVRKICLLYHIKIIFEKRQTHSLVPGSRSVLHISTHYLFVKYFPILEFLTSAYTGPAEEYRKSMKVTS